jgi:indole-3-glycerol phosphate synthase
MSVLGEIAASTRQRVSAQEAAGGLERAREWALSLPKGSFPFESALGKPGLSVICEAKRASPSKGIISREYPYAEIAVSYEEAGADAISVLTEPEFFLGESRHLSAISQAVSLPVIRKDFVVSEFQIYESKCLGAKAVLLIAAILAEEELASFFAAADSVGLSCLVETRSAEEAKMAVRIGARAIGANSRDLKTFEVDLSQIERVREHVPASALFCAESGVWGAKDIQALSSARPDAVLVGEAMMRSPNRPALVAELKEAATWL